MDSEKGIKQAPHEMKVPAYLLKMVASYFSDRLWKCVTVTGVKRYKVTQ